jgi:hypothetical protein
MQYARSQISVKRKNRMVGGVLFITNDVCEMHFPVKSPLLTCEYRNGGV